MTAASAALRHPPRLRRVHHRRAVPPRAGVPVGRLRGGLQRAAAGARRARPAAAAPASACKTTPCAAAPAPTCAPARQQRGPGVRDVRVHPALPPGLRRLRRQHHQRLRGLPRGLGQLRRLRAGVRRRNAALRDGRGDVAVRVGLPGGADALRDGLRRPRQRRHRLRPLRQRLPVGRQRRRAACAMGECRLTCNAGFADCDRAAANGCEVNLNSSAGNCGACGNACAAGPNARRRARRGAAGSPARRATPTATGSASNGCEVNVLARRATARCAAACAPAAPTAPPPAPAAPAGSRATRASATATATPSNGCETSLDTATPTAAAAATRAAAATPVCASTTGASAVCTSGCPGGQQRCGDACVDLPVEPRPLRRLRDGLPVAQQHPRHLRRRALRHHLRAGLRRL